MGTNPIKRNHQAGQFSPQLSTVSNLQFRHVILKHMQIFIACLMLFNSISFADTSVKEKNALEAVYNSTNGPGWRSSANWLTGDPCTNDWYGVTCDQDSHVTQLELIDNNLVATIPAEIGDLEYLEVLDFWGNELLGSIPYQMGNLDKVWFLDLGSNQLSGNIPSSLGGMRNLVELWLEDNQLSGAIPSQLGNLSQLESLFLYDNQLTGSIPSAIGSLRNLVYLDLTINRLTGTPPSSLSNLVNLKAISLIDNQFSGTIPAFFSNLPNLQALWLGGNQFTGPIPRQLGNIASLRSLVLFDNQLTGTIPPELGNLSALGQLDLSENQLYGSIPEEIGNLTNMEILYLYSNNFSGEVPSSLSKLSKIRTNESYRALALDYNALYTDDSNLDAFLNQKSKVNWSASQTVAPKMVRITGFTSNSVTLAWDPIEYTWDEGGYRVFYRTSPNGSYINGGITANKGVSSHTVSGLSTGQQYFFVVRTETRPHDENSNTVISKYSNEVSILDTATYSVGGEVTGLTGLGMILQLNNSNDMVISSNGRFTFGQKLQNGSSYSVTINTLPYNPSQNCFVTNGSGTIAGTDVTNVIVTCEQIKIPLNVGLNDAWYNPATDGQGFFITVLPESELVVASWFTYDTVLPPLSISSQIGAPGQRWLNAVGHFDQKQAVLDISYASGGLFDTATEVNEVEDGSIILSFDDCNSGTVEYDIWSINARGVVPIQRVVSDNIALCESLSQSMSNGQNPEKQKRPAPSVPNKFDVSTENDTPTLNNMNVGLNDAWYYSVTNGQGFYINVFPGIGYVSLSWFTFDASRPDQSITANLGEPGHRWLNAIGQYNGARAEMDITYAVGGLFDTSTMIEEINDGSITLSFSDCNNGTVEYNIPSAGLSGVVPIQRVASDNIAFCEELAALEAATTSCTPDSVTVGDACIDKYEASVWQTTNAEIITRIKSGLINSSTELEGLATQLGAKTDNYDSVCPNNAAECNNAYAVSIPGVIPADRITWFQAAATCRNAGKRLATNQEWQMAAFGTPDTGTDNGTTTCNLTGSASTQTGTRASCVSDVGAYDMVGNLWEWVSDWWPSVIDSYGSSTSQCDLDWGFFSDDYNCGARNVTAEGPSTMLRGGDAWVSGGQYRAGPFAIAMTRMPQTENANVGFRCARSKSAIEILTSN
jgi:Leucine-rich repeat (LRR) protein